MHHSFAPGHHVVAIAAQAVNATTGLIAAASATLAAPVALGVPTDDALLQRMQAELEVLKQANALQGQQIRELKAQHGEQWLSEQRAGQIQALVTDVLADADTRLNLQGAGATAGYDKGFFLASADGNFRLNIKGQLQTRVAYNHVSASAAPGGSQAKNEYGFEIRRAKVSFSGHVIDPTWKYELKMAFERNGAVTGASQVQLEEAFVQKDFGGGVFLRAGQWKDWFGYEEYTSSSVQQLVERSLVNQYFSPKFVQGIVLGIQQDRWRTWLSYNDGGGNRSVQVIQPMNLTEWAATARVEFMPVGDSWSLFRDMQGWRGGATGVMVGAAVNWQRGTGVQGVRNTVGNGSLPGAPGGGEQASLVTYTADLNLRGDGWSFLGAFYGNALYAFAHTPELPQDPISFGVTAQAGWFVTDELELVARYEGLWVSNGRSGPASPNALNSQTLNVLTLGGNWYFARNSVKFSADVGYAFNPVAFSSGLFGESIAGADWRPTAGAAGASRGEVVVRGQMQLLF